MSESASWQIGEMTVHRIEEIPLRGFGRWLLPRATPDVVAESAWLRPSYVDDDGQLLGSVHAFAVELGDARILVDSGVGNGKSRPFPAWDHLSTPFLDRLAAVGFTPENVNVVVNTHLHQDHVGWNTRLVGDTWVPTFVNARYVCAQAEHGYWADRELKDDEREMFADSIDPLRGTGQLSPTDVPEAGTEIAPGVRLLPAPGHTPGQVMVRLDSAGHSAVISADCLHHPVQFAQTDMCATADVDPAQATRTRQNLFAELAKSDTVLFGSHFDAPVAGRVRDEGRAYRFVPVPGE
ncbi:beta-lactamase domain protein [Streptomyces iranensis]|nr:beta-lactamase domain protein [Streptomyces iranensis]